MTRLLNQAINLRVAQSASKSPADVFRAEKDIESANLDLTHAYTMRDQGSIEMIHKGRRAAQKKRQTQSPFYAFCLFGA
jgi:hypothetical protein